MNCGPEQKLSMEELKRLNPSRCSLPQMRTTLPPTPTQQDWRELLIAMDRLERRLSDQTAVFAGAFHPDGCLPHPAPDRGPVAGCGPDTDAAATGWEEERAAFLCAQVGAAANPLAQPDSRTGSVPGSWRYALGSMVQLGKALEPAPSDFPVKDSTVKPRHTDRKLWQTQRRKKIALGHKPDDQENESVWQHSL